jgi:hypothetical protein
MATEEIDDAEVVDAPEQTPSHVGTELEVLRGSGIVRASAPTEILVASFQEYLATYERLLAPSDFQTVSGKKFPTKSGIRKLETAYAISVETTSKDFTFADDGRIVLAVIEKRATAPNGRFHESTGVCERFDKCCGRRWV